MTTTAGGGNENTYHETVRAKGARRGRRRSDDDRTSPAGRDVQNRLGDALNGEEENRLHAEILSAIAGGATTVGEIGRAVEAPEHVVKGCLSELADAGFVTREESGEWVLAE